jgi:predicted aspartyl protease
MRTCSVHPDVPFKYDCTGCGRPMCKACCQVGEAGFVCADCLVREKASGRRRLVQKLLFVLLVVFPLVTAVIGAIVYSVVTYEPPFDYGDEAENVARWRAAVEKRPCTPDTIVELGEAMIRAGDYEGAAETVEAWLVECGDNERVRWVTYGAYKRMGDWDRAAAEAGKLMAFDPIDVDYPWWRGFVLEQKGDLAAAARDYRQTMILAPEMSSIPFNWADTLGASKPCDGLHPLRQYAWFNPEAVAMSSVTGRIGDLAVRGRCQDGRGEVLVPLDAEGQLKTAVTVGQSTADMRIDPNLTFVILDAAFASASAVVQDREDTVVVRLAGETKPGWTGRASSIAIGAAVADDVPVLVVDGLGAEGIVGHSWLTRFEGIREADGGLRLRAYP